jgi:prolyl 4-hydroxylase
MLVTLFGLIVALCALVIAVRVMGFQSFEGFAAASKMCGNAYREIEDFLTAEECDTLRAAAETQGMTASQVGTSDDAYLDLSSRASRQAWIQHSENDVAAKILTGAKDLVRECLGEDLEYEQIQVVAYGEGGKYDPHYDGTECRDSCADTQRLATLLVYLNDGFGGGNTAFPKLGASIVPKKGKAVLFWVADPETRDLFEETLHGGDPVTDGEKWIATQWVLSPRP